MSCRQGLYLPCKNVFPKITRLKIVSSYCWYLYLFISYHNTYILLFDYMQSNLLLDDF